MPPAIGAVAEAVATLLLLEAGFEVFGQLVTPGLHGVDLLALTPAEQVLAVEVKGTLRAGSIPRLAGGRPRQMSIEWLNSPANPLMAEWGLEALDLYGAILVVDLALDRWRAASTADFTTFTPVRTIPGLAFVSAG